MAEKNDRGGWRTTDQAREAREQNFSDHVTVYPDFVNDDGSVSDMPARKFAERQYAQSGVSPKDRVPDDHSVGTPAWVEQNSPDNMHSDGGPTLAPEADSVLDVLENSEQIKKEQEESIKAGVERAEKARGKNKSEKSEDKEDEKKSSRRGAGK